MISGETLTNAGLAAANPNKAVPVLDDNGFTMFERYLIMSQQFVATFIIYFF